MKGIVIKMGKVVVSAVCWGAIVNTAVRGNNYSEKLHKWLEGKEVIEVCPEVAERTANTQNSGGELVQWCGNRPGWNQQGYRVSSGAVV